MRHAKRRWRSGQGMVEFALIAPIFFMMLIGVIEGGRLIWMNHELANGTREAARLAMVRGTESGASLSLTDLENRILNTTAGLNGGDLTVTTSPGLPVGEPGDTITITAEYDYDVLTGIIPGLGDMTLSHSSTVIIQH